MMAHEDLGLDQAAHDPGCVTRHISGYVENNVCSHRWQAAKRALKEWGTNYPDEKPTSLAESTLKTYMSQGKICKSSGNYKPFATQNHPWRNEAHHIIPRSTLARSIEDISKAAEPNADAMFEAAIVFLLEEKYNLNDEKNMIMLPLEHKVAVTLGLPEHLKGGAWDHPQYSAMVKSRLKLKLDPVYKSLADATRKRKHPKKFTKPAVRKILETISDNVYRWIIAKTKAVRQGQPTSAACLDSITPLTYK